MWLQSNTKATSQDSQTVKTWWYEVYLWPVWRQNNIHELTELSYTIKTRKNSLWLWPIWPQGSRERDTGKTQAIQTLFLNSFVFKTSPPHPLNATGEPCLYWLLYIRFFRMCFWISLQNGESCLTLCPCASSNAFSIGLIQSR